MNAPQITVNPTSNTLDSSLLLLQVVNAVEGELLVMKEYSGITLDVTGVTKIFVDDAENSAIELKAG